MNTLDPDRRPPRYFSYRRHVLQNIWPETFPSYDVYGYNDDTVSAWERGAISVMDIRVVADPGSYRMGTYISEWVLLFVLLLSLTVFYACLLPLLTQAM